MRTEQRTTPRVQRRLRAWYRATAGVFRRTRLLDLGPEGARILTEQGLGGEVHLTLRLDLSRYVTVVARAAWHRPAKGGGFLTGLHFQEPQVRDWVRREALLDQLYSSARTTTPALAS